MKDSSRPTSPLTGRGASTNEIHDEEEGLPLYESLGSASKPAIPSKEASPAEVRTFIYQLLVSSHGLEEASAREIANRWKLGGGMELRRYPMTLYTDIFGPEESWVVFRSVSMMLQEENRPQRERSLRNTHICYGILVGVIFTLTLVLSLIFDWGWMFLAIFTIPGLLIAWAVTQSNLRKSNEEIVNLKMQSFKTPDRPTSVPLPPPHPTVGESGH